MVQHSATVSFISCCSAVGRPGFCRLVGQGKQQVCGQVNKGFNSIIILGAWLVWKHCNYCVFDGGIPNLSWVLLAFREEAQQWSVAGA